MRIGIDFGTTHTSASVYDGHELRFIPLDQQNQSPSILRSMIYIDRKQRHCLGLQAVQTFLAEDTGREVVYEAKLVGTITNTVASLDTDENVTIIYDTVIDEDVGARGRLLQSIKTGLRFGSYTGTKIFGKYYTLEELIALILGHVRQRAEQTLQTEVRAAALGRPVIFADDPASDLAAENRLRRAAELAGFTDIVFVPEPIAAARFYLSQVNQPETLLVFDFGGGTLDLTIIQAGGQQPYTVLATQGVLIGGDDLDSAIMRDCVGLHFGVKSKIDISYDGREVYFDDEMVNQLYRWQTIPLLSRPKALAIIERAKRYGENPGAFAQLAALVTKNYGFPLFEQIEQAKRLLSTEFETTLTMQADVIDLMVNISRAQFNRAIGNETADIRDALRSVVKTAGIAMDQIDTLVTTGGSSAIPHFQNLLQREFPQARLVHSDLLGSVAGGLGIYAHTLRTG